MKRGASIITLGSIYIGTVIGAGFASGQEIIQFFVRYGKQGLLGVVVSTLFFCILGGNLLHTIYTKKIDSLEEFLFLYFRKRTITLINLWLIGFLFISYFIMLAGSGAIFKEYLQINQFYGIILMSFICFIVFITGVKGIARANVILIPFLLTIICYIGVSVIKNNSFIFSQWTTESIFTIKDTNLYLTNLIWIGSAILYVAFNTISTLVVFSSLRPMIKDEKSAIYGGIVGGLGLGVMALLISVSLLVLYTDIIGLEIPMIVVANSAGHIFRRLYSIVLLVAMFTTAIANGYGCVLRICNLSKINARVISLFICCISVPMATLGFKRLVTFFYPIFGYIGVIFIVVLLVKGQKVNLSGVSKDFIKKC